MRDAFQSARSPFGRNEDSMKQILASLLVLACVIIAIISHDRATSATEAAKEIERNRLLVEQLARTAARVKHENDSLRHAQSIKIAAADTAHANRLNADHHAQAALSSASFDSLNLVFLTGAVEAAPE